MANDSLERARVRVDRKARQQRLDEDQRTEGSAKRAAVQRTLALQGHTGFRRFLFENGLVLAALSLFLFTFAGQVLTGHAVYNQEQQAHAGATIALGEYLRSGHFLEATAENWESEFLQMAVFVVLTVFLYQRGSSESKVIEASDAVDQRPEEARHDPDAPWPVRRGGLALVLYEHSLSIVLLALFVLSFLLHAAGGAKDYNEEQATHGGAPLSAIQYMATSRFWFESLQNWQSEFFSIAVIVLFSIWLRERGSPQSKPVAAGHHETGE